MPPSTSTDYLITQPSQTTNPDGPSQNTPFDNSYDTAFDENISHTTQDTYAHHTAISNIGIPVQPEPPAPDITTPSTPTTKNTKSSTGSPYPTMTQTDPYTGQQFEHTSTRPRDNTPTITHTTQSSQKAPRPPATLHGSPNPKSGAEPSAIPTTGPDTSDTSSEPPIVTAPTAKPLARSNTSHPVEPSTRPIMDPSVKPLTSPTMGSHTSGNHNSSSYTSSTNPRSPFSQHTTTTQQYSNTSTAPSRTVNTTSNVDQYGVQPPDVPNPFSQTTNQTPRVHFTTDHPPHMESLDSRLDRMAHISENILNIQLSHTSRNITNEDTLHRIIDRTAADYDQTYPSGRKKFNEMTSGVRTIFRRMTIINIYDEEPTDPSDILLQMLESRNKAQQTSFLNGLLKERKTLGKLGTGHINRLLCLGPLWSDRNDPFGLTMLGIYCSGLPDFGSLLALEYAIRDNMHDKMEKKDLEILTKKELFGPSSVHKIRIIFTTYEALLSLICTNTAIIPQVLRGWILHFDENFSDYQTLFTESSLFGIRLLYAIDLSLQLYLEKLANETIPATDISRTNIEDQMTTYQSQIEIRQFSTRLPPNLQKLFDNRKRKADNDNKKPGQNGNINRHNNANPAINQRGGFRRQVNGGARNPVYYRNSKECWKLPANKQFHHCFYGDTKRNNKVPRHDDTEFCVKYFVLGECLNGNTCRFLHKDPRDCPKELGLEAKFDEFCKIAFS
jgi:hypothetical protein